MRISHSSPPSLLNTFLSAQQNEEEEEEEEYIVLGKFHQQQQQQEVCQRTLFIKFFLKCLQKNFVQQILLKMFAKELCSSNSSSYVTFELTDPDFVHGLLFVIKFRNKF
jgi:hypothetical protein